MAPIYKDRVLEASDTVGVGAYVLGGALLGYQSFRSVPTASQCYYAAHMVDANGNPAGDWEVGLGTTSYDVTTSTLLRTRIIASSNAHAAVNWPVGVKHIALTITAESMAGAVAGSAHHVTHEPGGADALVNAAWTNKGNIFTDDQIIAKPGPTLRLTTTNAALDQKRWVIGVDNAPDVVFQTRSDAGAVLRDVMTLAFVSGVVTIPGGLGATPLNATQLTSGTVAAARLPANLAYKDSDNNFTTDQHVAGGVITGYLHATGHVASGGGILYFRSADANNPALRADGTTLAVVLGDQSNYAGLQAASVYTALTGSNLADLTVRGSTSFQGGVNATTVYTTTPGSSLADLTVRGGTNFQGGVTLTGGDITISAGGGAVLGGLIFPKYADTGAQQTAFYLGGSSAYGGLSTNGSFVVGTTLYVLSNTHLTGQLYPGRVDVAASQTSWYLGSHASFGLYCNTGMLFAGSVHCNTTLNVTGLLVAAGYRSRAGTNGPNGADSWNIYWNAPNGTMEMWLNTSYFGNFVISSDARLKRDFTPLTRSLDTVCQLKPGSFFFREGRDIDRHVGLLAQDVRKVAPEFVRNTEVETPLTPDGLLQVNYIEMIPLLISAIQELDRKISHRH